MTPKLSATARLIFAVINDGNGTRLSSSQGRVPDRFSSNGASYGYGSVRAANLVGRDGK